MPAERDALALLGRLLARFVLGAGHDRVEDAAQVRRGRSADDQDLGHGRRGQPATDGGRFCEGERMRRILLALVVVAASFVWAVAMVAGDVSPRDNSDGLSCGGAHGALAGKPTYGGEMPYPDDWVEQCRAVANDRVVWAAVPAVTGSLATAYLLVLGATVVRQAKAEGRSRGALQG
jgi:hypothetical protein